MSQYLCVYRLERDDHWHLQKCHVFYDGGDFGVNGLHHHLSNLMAKMYPQGWSTEYWNWDHIDCAWTTCVGMRICTDEIPTVIPADGDVTIYTSLNEMLKGYW